MFYLTVKQKKILNSKIPFKCLDFSPTAINSGFIRLMRRWAGQTGAPNDFSRCCETPNTPTHYSDNPFFHFLLISSPFTADGRKHKRGIAHLTKPPTPQKQRTSP